MNVLPMVLIRGLRHVDRTGLGELELPEAWRHHGILECARAPRSSEGCKIRLCHWNQLRYRWRRPEAERMRAAYRQSCECCECVVLLDVLNEGHAEEQSA